MNQDRIKEIFSDEDFVKKVMEQETAEGVQALLADKDIDLSVAEIEKIRELMMKQMNGEIKLEELSDEDLESVTGGLCGLTVMLVAGACVSVIAGAGAVLGGAGLTHHYTRSRW